MSKVFLMMIGSYLVGCFNTGYYYTQLFYKKDVRSIGTKVTGATNVGRVAGKKGFVVTFLGDSLKGALVVFLSRLLELTDIMTLLCVLMVIAGHIMPIQLKFHGGKGISTMFGAFLLYRPTLILFLAITCAVLLPFIKRYTVTSLFAMILLPLELLIAGYEKKELLLILLCMLMIIYACRSNLKEFFQKAG